MSVIEFRDPIPSDLEQLNLLKNRYIAKLYDDDSFLDLDTLTWEYLESCRPLIFTSTLKGYEDIVVGAVEFTDFHPLYARLHFTFYPRFLPTFLKDKVYLDALVDRFRLFGVDSFVSTISAYNTGVIALAKRIGFREVGRVKNQYRHYGQKYDEIIMQLEKSDIIRAIREDFLKEEGIQEPMVSKVTKIPRKRKARVQQQK